MNETIFLFFYNLAHQSVVFDWLVVSVGEWLGIILIGASLAFLLLHRDPAIRQHLKEIGLVLVSALLAWGLASILKLLIGSPRPFDAYSTVKPLFTVADQYGFPSGHATFFSALAIAFYLHHRRMGIVFGISALLIGIARIIGGVHFPFDILGGFALGTIVAVFSHRYILPSIRRTFRL